jgi:SpoVK/Ycf46/Vps4 family AAA+-type ATPase
MPWFGLPEQFSLISKYNYSIRVKVALLADLVLSKSVKLDMITDLLVIIDSVKSNRGFAVFATTHIPYILTLLRRPGRFDETISIL